MAYRSDDISHRPAPGWSRRQTLALAGAAALSLVGASSWAQSGPKRGGILEVVDAGHAQPHIIYAGLFRPGGARWP